MGRPKTLEIAIAAVLQWNQERPAGEAIFEQMEQIGRIAMNTSNPFGTEHIARERQAEIEKQLRLAAQLRELRPARTRTPLMRGTALALASLSLIGLIVTIIATQVR